MPVFTGMNYKLNLNEYSSKDVDQFVGQHFDYIITVCDNAKERCPFVPGQAERIHWSFEDPAAAKGTEAEILAVFRKVRDQIKNRIKVFISQN
jgi:arsenate reductase